MGNAVRRGGRGTAGKVVLIVLAAVFLLGTVGLVVFGILNSVMLLPYKRQAIYDYYADDANYYDISGVVEKAEHGDLYLNGERCLRLSLDEVVSDKPFIKESGVVEFDLPLGMFDALGEDGFFAALSKGAEVGFRMAWDVWGNDLEIAVFSEASVNGVSYPEAGEGKAFILDWIENELS